MRDDVIGHSVDLRISVTDPGDELGQGCQPCIAGKGFCHCSHNIGHSCAGLPVLQATKEQLLSVNKIANLVLQQCDDAVRLCTWRSRQMFCVGLPALA